LGEHQLDKLGVTGSSPVPPTHKASARPGALCCFPRRCPSLVQCFEDESLQSIRLLSLLAFVEVAVGLVKQRSAVAMFEPLSGNRRVHACVRHYRCSRIAQHVKREASKIDGASARSSGSFLMAASVYGIRSPRPRRLTRGACRRPGYSSFLKLRRDFSRDLDFCCDLNLDRELMVRHRVNGSETAGRKS
jgi:hypothetical protein